VVSVLESFWRLKDNIKIKAARVIYINMCRRTIPFESKRNVPGTGNSFLLISPFALQLPRLISATGNNETGTVFRKG
jgi:hypothetical protein